MDFNIYKPNTSDFAYLLQVNGSDVQIMDSTLKSKQIRATITNLPGITTLEYNDRFINSIDKIKCGDMVQYDGSQWIVIDQVSRTRYGTYKGIMRRSTSVLVNLSTYADGNYTKYNVMRLPCILSRTSDFKYDIDRFFKMVDGEMHLIAQRNEYTYQMQDKDRKHNIIIGQDEWEIVGISTITEGLLDVTLRIKPLSAHTDQNTGIMWHSEKIRWDKKINNIFFDGKDNLPDIPDTPKQTNVGTINYTTSPSRESDGKIYLSWDKDTQSTNGYRLTLYKGDIVVETKETTDLFASFGNLLKETNYKITIQSKNNNDYLPAQATPEIFIEKSGGWW